MEEPKHVDFDLKYVDEGKVAVLAFNRPKKFNALTWEHFSQLKIFIEYLGRVGSDVKAIVLTGIGAHFSAGLDLTSAMTIG